MRDDHAHCGYHGRFISSRVVKDLPLAEAVYAPNLELPRHSHLHAGFCLILRGSYTESYGRTSLECRPSSVKFQPAGETHTDAYGNERVHCFIVELKAEWLKRTGAHALVGGGPAVFAAGSVAWLMMRLRREFHAEDDEAPLVIEGLLLQLLAETSRGRKAVAGGENSRWLLRAKEFLDDSFLRPLTLSAVAAAAGVHPAYLANSFRLHYRCSVGEYLRLRRVEFACHKISTSKDSLADIALAAGFSNQSHFSRIFKRTTGMTPAQYRAACGPS